MINKNSLVDLHRNMEWAYAAVWASVLASESALQVAMHSLYHIGQINARLREIGGEPPLVDYIAWVWLGRPSPEWAAGDSK